MNQGKLVRAVESVLSERNLTAAAILCKMSTRALRDLQKTPEFISLMNEQKSQIMNAVSSRLIGMAVQAVDVLQLALEDGGLSAADRTPVALRVLDLCQDAHRWSQAEQRLAELESGSGGWETLDMQLPKGLLKREND